MPVPICLTLVLALLVLAPAGAEEAQRDRSIHEVVEEARKAFAAKDEKARAALVGGVWPDPWWLAENLRRVQAFDAAAWIAGGVEGANGKALRDYLEAVRQTPPDAEAWKTLETVRAHVRKGERERALALLLAAKPDRQTVLGIELLFGRGELLIGLKRFAEIPKHMAVTAKAAEDIGWLMRAHRANLKAGRALWAVAEHAHALPHFERAIAFARTLGATEGEGEATYMRGVSRLNLGRMDEALVDFVRTVALGREAKSDKVVSKGLDGQGMVHEGRGDSYTAVKFRRQAIELAEKARTATA